MVKSMWVVEVTEYDCFTGTSYKQTEFSNMQEAFACYKERKDFDYGDHYRRTTIFHTFVYEDEEKIRQDKRREERRRSKEAEKWETRPMTEEEYEASGLRDISSESPVEPEEYVFDDGENPFEDLSDERFDGVAFNGLVYGAGEFPLWEKDSHK